MLRNNNRNIDMKFEVDTFQKKVIKKSNFFHENSKFKGGNSDKFYARVEQTWG
jgi:hypothetical protein